eukprot:scaffold731_cov261-Pinguiococcus_pyrenoidosus.AAC.25
MVGPQPQQFSVNPIHSAIVRHTPLLAAPMRSGSSRDDGSGDASGREKISSRFEIGVLANWRGFQVEFPLHAIQTTSAVTDRLLGKKES